MAPGWGLFTGKSKPGLEAWNFQLPPYPQNSLVKGKGLDVVLTTGRACMVKPP